jgi:hypothetical protein
MRFRQANPDLKLAALNVTLARITDACVIRDSRAGRVRSDVVAGE